MAYVIECIKLASDLGARIVRTFASGMGAPHAVEVRQQIEWVVEMAREAAKFAEELSVTMVIQNHSPIGNDIHNLVQIVKSVDSPAYRAAIDCPLLTRSGVDYAEALHACNDILAFTTAGDFKDAEGVPLGQGECDWPKFLRLLKEIGYDFWINYEMCSKMRGGGSEENLDSIASESLRYLRRLISEIYE